MMNTPRWFVRFVGGLVLLLAYGLGWAQDFLPPEKAFPMQQRVEGQTVVLSFDVAPGYYLYRERFQIAPANASTVLGEVDIPHAKKKFDENLGQEVEPLRGLIEVRVPIQSAADGRAQIMVTSQGCADAGLCYPPVMANVAATLSAGSSAAEGAKAGPSSGDEAGQLAQRLKNESLLLVLAAFFGLGALLAFTPCVLPMVPILSAAIVSDASHPDAQAAGQSRGRAMLLALSYVLGMASVYSTVGVVAGLTGESLVVALQTPWVLGVFASILLVLGVGMMGAFDVQLPGGFQSWVSGVSSRMPGGRVGSVAVMGAASALLVGPCVAPPLAGALLFVGQTGNWVTGGLALFALALGMGFPMVLAAGSAGQLLPKAGAWMEGVKEFFGWLLIGLAIWTATPLLPDWALMVAWGVLAALLGVRLGALEPMKDKALSSVLKRTLAALLVLLAVMELGGVASGGRDILQPLAHLGGKGAVVHSLPFERVPAGQVMQRVAAAGRPVMLDFYADWCVSCKEMEKLTFPSPKVQSALEGVLWLQVDVTANNDADKALLKQFQLFGPPAILFFDAKGQELTQGRVVGFQNADKFADLLKSLRPLF